MFFLPAFFFFCLFSCKCVIETHTYLRRVSLTFSFRPFSPVLPLSSVLHSWTHTHTHKHARTSLWAKLSFPLIHLLVCIFLFPFTSRFAGTIASPLFTAHTLSLSSSSLLLLHVTPNTLSVLLVFFFFTVTTIRFHGVIHSPWKAYWLLFLFPAHLS